MQTVTNNRAIINDRYSTMTVNQLKMFFQNIPLRDIGGQELRAFFQYEADELGIPKGKLKKLVNDGFLESKYFNPSKESGLNGGSRKIYIVALR